MKKIALELQPCLGNRSGIGTYTYELVKRVKNTDGLEFHGKLFNFADRRDVAKILKEVSIPVQINSLLSYGVYRRIWNTVPIPYDCLFSEKADLSIFFDFIVPPRIQGKIMTTIHDMTVLRYPETMSQRNRHRICQGLDYSIQRSNRIITVSEFSKREIMELLNVPEEKISVVYSAPSCSEQRTDAEKLKEKLGIRGPFLLYVGNLEPRKNIQRLLKAYSILRAEYHIPHQLVLVGGTGWGSEAILRAAKEEISRGQILIPGYLSEPEKNTLYAHATAFVFPSLYEGFGMPPLEAMCFECPVICSNVGSLPEVVGNAAELVDPLEEEAIAQGIWRVLSSDNYAAQLRDKGHKQAARFTWEASVRQLIEICKIVLKEI